MNKTILAAGGLWLMILLSGCTSHDEDILFTNAHITNHPNANAILVRNGLIKDIGQAKDFTGIKTVDLMGGIVYPGFTDAHMHLVGYGWSKETLDLVGTESIEQVLAMVKKAVSTTPKDRWIQGRGWDQNDWDPIAFPTKEMLDYISPDNPIVLRRIDGHAVWVNSKVLDLANVTPETQDPNGGKILRDKTGVPTGVFIDNAIDLVSQVIPEDTKADKRRMILTAQHHLNAVGLTSIHDAGTDKETIEILDELSASGDLTLRIYTMLNDDIHDYENFLKSGPLTDNPYYKVRSVKLYMDGALGSRGAALLAPYDDDLDNVGLILTDSAEVSRRVALFNEKGFQVGVHCIGDRANRIMLDIYESIGRSESRNRIEHAQIIHVDDIPRFSQLGVIPSMQTTHCTSDMYWADERLGSGRIQEAYPWQSLIQSGSIIPGGTDAPVEFPDPLASLYAAVTRQDAQGWPEGGWLPEQRLTMDQAIKTATEWPAYASFEENIKGKIARGFYADFTVLDRPLNGNHPKEILKTEILFTIVGGKVVYQK